ncbi:hypothetical protein ACOSP7_007987 [Xanthoceras sorbifolium]|uniref:Peptidase A1 domain-containing protein n=1 Tax=Xanthoceras sorbifolium TaxID=99658 RepID=A0ABQ8IBJ1_9ROSI|nr:hypothetical protein JRO89_XS03G0239500 [Xanthoceras sorbifolium]
MASFGYLLCFCVLFLSSYWDKSCVYGARELANHQHVVNKKESLMHVASTACSASTKGLQIAHRYGPCSPLGQENPPPTFREILQRDQSRVRSLYSTPSSSDISNDESEVGAKLALHDKGNFVVQVGFGTPKQDLTLMFDTGSYMTWIQCLPCTNCYDQEEPIFDPSKSSTFSNPSCNTPTCPPYSIVYHDDSYTSGNYAKDTLTLSSTNVVHDFVFGCSKNNSATFGKVAGVLGVGQGDTSIMSQTLDNFGQEFCYCLPLRETSTGYLLFGIQAFETCSEPEISVPLITDLTGANHYFVKLVGITIGQKRLEISATGSLPSTIVDSGTIISRLPGSVYAELRSSFQELMSQYPKVDPDPLSLLDTCYDLSGYDDNIDNIVFPMTLHFGDSKDLKLDPSAVVSQDSNSQTVCLAFAGNDNSDDLTIIGNHQQRNLKIYYSMLDKIVGFSTGGCGN